MDIKYADWVKQFVPFTHNLMLIEASVFLVVICFIVSKWQKGSKKPTIDSNLVQRNLRNWKPEPLINNVDVDHPSLRPLLVTSPIGRKVMIDGLECLNLATSNFLGLLENDYIKERATETIRKYGVGSCGPRGFYGTVDVHLELEERLAKFMNMEEAIVYSYGFSTVASAIPAYCKHKDIVFVDEKVNFAIQKGLDASRSAVRFFKHNDTKDLERLLEEQRTAERRNSKSKAVKKFLIVEGIYMNTGTLCPLPKLVSLSRKYELRIFIDESVSFGAIGKSGRGVTDYFNVPVDEIDMIMSSLELATGSVGGFCVGSSFVIEHQRLSGLGYCFSASLPPLLTVAVTSSLDILESDSSLLLSLRNNCMALHEGLINSTVFDVSGAPESPIKHLHLKEEISESFEKNNMTEEAFYSRLISTCMDNKLLVLSPSYLKSDTSQPKSSLRICVSANLDKDDIAFSLQTIDSCAKQIFSF